MVSIRAQGRSIESMRKYHGDALAVYETVAPKMKGKILDIASGTGTGTYLLSQHAKQVTGADIDEQSVKDCAKRYSAKNLSFVQADASKRWPFADKSFDTITTFETIEHLYKPQRKAYLRELRRVLKDNGTIYLSTPQNGIEREVRPCPPPAHPYDHKIEFCLKDLKTELQAAGFSIAKVGGIKNKAVKAGQTRHGTKSPPAYRLGEIVQPVTRLVPMRLKELLLHPLLGYPYHIRNFTYTKKPEEAFTFLIELKKRK